MFIIKGNIFMSYTVQCSYQTKYIHYVQCFLLKEKCSYCTLCSTFTKQNIIIVYSVFLSEETFLWRTHYAVLLPKQVFILCTVFDMISLPRMINFSSIFWPRSLKKKKDIFMSFYDLCYRQ